ncbi:hypothetical protein BST95_12555 [Halioglobus japonicus]|uniref:Thiopurine S-methyltransferase n=1 Tax=Halioglobus japonicus TaxID=930805 RepID=A0AAP8MHV9_9GAMM|nr:hypothetical protein BST95_12555 [Halioglobus japonicus]PLW88040.1 hypothetical protein C0029_05630 [Halioglobus japonicus]GHD20551.1 hypothetical protein GCM10007052_30360 [Halioglobus japonicus]
MEASFWEDRWTNSKIGFHEGETNRHLAQYWESLDVAAVEAVFVPLAGKTLDIAWLMRSHPVLANEVSATAAKAFFAEHGIDHTQ